MCLSYCMSLAENHCSYWSVVSEIFGLPLISKVCVNRSDTIMARVYVTYKMTII